MPRRKKDDAITKRLQIELQSSLAFSIWDSTGICNAGKSMKKAVMLKTMEKMYFPKLNKKDDRMSAVDLFLAGQGKFKYFFDIDHLVDNDELIVNPLLHRLSSTLFVGKGSITRSLLTRRNKKNPADITTNTLLKHATEVGKNCKKAMALCKSSHSPYKNYDGKLPSGQNWKSFIEWIRVEMYKELELKDEVVEEDDDDMNVDDDGDAVESEQSKSLSQKKKVRRRKKMMMIVIMLNLTNHQMMMTRMMVLLIVMERKWLKKIQFQMMLISKVSLPSLFGVTFLLLEEKSFKVFL